MYTKEQLMSHLAEMGVDPKGTLLVHSSMKAIGAVDGGADTVLDALQEYMKDGLLVLPTHTWSSISHTRNVCDIRTEPSCVGLLPNMFMKREGVIRSLHPTHSVAAFGKDAKDYVAGEENSTTPCARAGCWGKLLDRGAQILMLGCDLSKFTFLHGVEEWFDVPGRVDTQLKPYFVIDQNGVQHATPQYRHVNGVSSRYTKMEPIFLQAGALRFGHFGDAKCRLVDSVKATEITGKCIARKTDLFSDEEPIEV